MYKSLTFVGFFVYLKYSKDLNSINSVKAGQKLSTWQMQEIIKKWRKTKIPYTCPHGRTVSKVLVHKEIAKFFQRNA